MVSQNRGQRPIQSLSNFDDRSVNQRLSLDHDKSLSQNALGHLPKNMNASQNIGKEEGSVDKSSYNDFDSYINMVKHHNNRMDRIASFGKQQPNHFGRNGLATPGMRNPQSYKHSQFSGDL